MDLLTLAKEIADRTNLPAAPPLSGTGDVRHRMSISTPERSLIPRPSSRSETFPFKPGAKR
jgi:hypothetical protein